MSNIPPSYFADHEEEIEQLKKERDLFRAEALAAREIIRYSNSTVNTSNFSANAMMKYLGERAATDEAGLK